jgi:hypothetical protein
LFKKQRAFFPGPKIGPRGLRILIIDSSLVTGKKELKFRSTFADRKKISFSGDFVTFSLVKKEAQFK